MWSPINVKLLKNSSTTIRSDPTLLNDLNITENQALPVVLMSYLILVLAQQKGVIEMALSLTRNAVQLVQLGPRT